MRVNYAYVFLGSLLLVLVGCSKQVILYNEEIIVAVAFVGFVVVTERMIMSASESVFNERRASLLYNLVQYLQVQEAYCVECVKHHELRSTCLRSSTQMIGEALSNDMIIRCGPHCNETVTNCVSDQLSGQLKTLVGVQDQSRELFQSQIVSRFRNTVCNQFRFAKLRKHQSNLVKESIVLHTHTRIS